MKKLITNFSLNWHYLLDIILTHLFVISFLQSGFAVAAGLLMSTDSFFRITLSIYMTRKTAKIPLHIRTRISAALRLFLILIWFVAVSQLPIHSLSVYIFIPFIIFKLCLMIDSSLSADFVFSLRDLFQIDLSQSAAGQNILLRGGTAFAPAVALVILTYPYARWLGLSLAAILWLLSLFLLCDLFFTSSTKYAKPPQTENFTFSQLMTIPLMRWGIIFQFLCNLAFAGVAFLLLSQLQLQGHVFFNEITALYSAFLIIQSGVLFFGEKIIPINTITQIPIIMTINSLLIIFVGLCNHSLIRLLFCVGVGINYAFLLSGAQKVIITKLRGPGFIEYSGWAQSTGRLASLAVTFLLGMAIKKGVLSTSLLIFCGELGIGSALILALLPASLRIRNLYSTEKTNL